MKRIVIEIPDKLWEAALSPEAKIKPYNVCHFCDFMSETCDGPNGLAMGEGRWVEWSTEAAKRKNKSRAAISEDAGVPIATFNSIMSGKTRDARYSTMQALTRAHIGGCWGKYPCHMVALIMNGKAEETPVSGMENQLRAEIAYLKRQAENQEKIIAALLKQNSK